MSKVKVRYAYYYYNRPADPSKNINAESKICKPADCFVMHVITYRCCWLRCCSTVLIVICPVSDVTACCNCRQCEAASDMTAVHRASSMMTSSETSAIYGYIFITFHRS